MKKVISASLDNRLLVVLLLLAVLAGGIWSYRQLPVDAYPDISPALVQIFVETRGLAPEEVEAYVTYPLESVMNGLPSLDHVRSVSNFGLSVVNIYFTEGTDIYFARQQVAERLALAREAIPPAFGEPVMGPISTGLGQILFYVLEDTTGEYSSTELRKWQDWLIKRNLQTVTGVAEVLSIGGEVKQYQIVIQPEALLQYGVSLPAVRDAIVANNTNAGAGFIVRNDEEYILRSVGFAANLEALGQIVIKTVDGTPVYLHQLGELKIGGAIRRGVTTYNGQGEAVVGMVLKLVGANTDQVIRAVKEELARVNQNLPAGLGVRPYYDQAQLVNAAVSTVTSALLQGVALVMLVLLVLMGGWRSSLVVALSIPFSVGFALLAMYWLGISANLMSLGGLAIAIGMMVDGAVVVVEAIDSARRNNSGADKSSRYADVLTACSEVARPILFAISIIIVVFLPLFTLQGVEGTTFRPLAYTVALAMLGSLLYALVLAPVLSYLLPGSAAKSSAVADNILAAYRRVVRASLQKRLWPLALAAVLLISGAVVAPRLGSEFVPRLNEGDLLIRATLAPSVSLDKATQMISYFERQLLAEFPEVRQVVSRIGRGEVGAHADPVNNAEIFVALAPQDEWTRADSLEELYSAMSEAFEDFPGVQFTFTQPIAAAVDELLTGTKAELALKIFGDDLDVLAEQADAMVAVLRTLKGAQDVQRDQISGAPQLEITLNREAISRYGLNVSEVQDVLQIGVGGVEAGQVFEGVQRFAIYLRLAENARDRAEAIGDLVLTRASGQQVQLTELADIHEITGPRQITRENNQRFITVQTNVRGRDIGSFVAEANQRIARDVSLPAGYFVRWGGQFELQQKAAARLQLVIPATLALVCLMLYLNFGSLGLSLLILLNIPLALMGGVLALWLAGLSLSVPAAVGFIALFGIALENALVLVERLNQCVARGMAIPDACIEASVSRLRPVAMTAVTTGLGLLPLLYATGTGSEVQRPLAVVVVGGLVSATLVTLIVIPAIYPWFIKPKVNGSA